MLNSKSATPLYVQLLDELEDNILTGLYQPGAQLPAESALAQQYGVSIITVRTAIGGLSEKGLVERKQGKGTFVKKPKLNRDSSNLGGFSQNCVSQGLVPGSRTIACEKVLLDPKTAKSLGTEPGSEGIYFARVRCADGEPVAIEKTYFSMDYAFLLEESLEDVSLFEILRTRVHVRVVRSEKNIEVCRATRQEGLLLNVPEHTPLLFVKSVTYGENGAPIYTAVQILNADRFTLRVTQLAGT